MVLSGSQWFLGSHKQKGCDRIMLLPESLHIQSCALHFAEQKLMSLY